MTVHQFRHLCAKHLLDADPGGYVSARQLLGHRNVKTTVNYYAGIDTRRAGRLHASLIQAVLDKAEEAPPPKKRKRTTARRPPTTSGRKTRA